MRILASLFFAALAFSPVAHAQLLIPSVDLGVAGGVNFGSINDAVGAELNNSTGFHIGVYGDVSMSIVSFRGGLYYLQAGNVETGDAQENVSADFITVPVDFHVQLPVPIVRPYALVGPELRFPIGEKGEFVDTESVNVAVNFGVGAKLGLPVGPSGFLELRYALDATGFAENTVLETDNHYKVSMFMLRAGIGI